MVRMVAITASHVAGQDVEVLFEWNGPVSPSAQGEGKPIRRLPELPGGFTASFRRKPESSAANSVVLGLDPGVRRDDGTRR